jgi:hypothetical protein
MATSGLRAGNPLLGQILGLFSVARMPLSIKELTAITGKQQRETQEEGIRPILPFLVETDSSFTFYHAKFHEFVTRRLLYDEEIRESHRRIADWLLRPENSTHGYRWASLAHHLFASGNREQLIQTIDEHFLVEKVRRLGYAVLEDVELWTRSLLDVGDPALVERCVEIVERLREVVGGDIIPDAAKAIQPHSRGTESFRTRLIVPMISSAPGLDAYVAILPKAVVAADFFEIVPLKDRLVVAIGDVPDLGLKSAFVARFIGNLFRKLVTEPATVQVGEVLKKLNLTLEAHDYFRSVSMQCVEFDLGSGILHIANAGHPYPVHYSANRGKCDILPVLGTLLHSPLRQPSRLEQYEEYGIDIGPGDIVVLVTDGLTEGHLLKGDPYKYRFTGIVERHANEGAETIGEAILSDWRRHPREGDFADDASVIVIKVDAIGQGAMKKPKREKET